MNLAWHEEPVSKGHPRDGFDCGDADLNTYLKKFARQNHESGGAKTFVAIDDATGRVLGFYSLAPAVAEYERTPEAIRRGLSATRCQAIGSHVWRPISAYKAVDSAASFCSLPVGAA